MTTAKLSCSEAKSEECKDDIKKQDLVGIAILNHEMKGIEEEDFEEDSAEDSDVLSEISEEDSDGFVFVLLVCFER